MPDTPQMFTRSFIVEELRKRIFGLLFLVAVSILVWLFTPISEKVSGIWHSPEKLQSIEENQVEGFRAQAEQLSKLSDQVAAINGEDRVIRQSPGQSYVTEPVGQGEDVTLNLVAQRTALGERCKLVASQSLFTDARGVAMTGKSGSVKRQIGTDATRLIVVIEPPKTLLPGRIELYLALEYLCDGRTVFDRTDTVYYTLTEKE